MICNPSLSPVPNHGVFPRVGPFLGLRPGAFGRWYSKVVWDATIVLVTSKPIPRGGTFMVLPGLQNTNSREQVTARLSDLAH